MERAIAPTNAAQALECFIKLSKPTERSLDTLFLTAAWIYNHSNNRDEKLRLSERMLDKIKLHTQYPSKDYWQAVYLSFSSQQKDSGKVIPTQTLKNLNMIKDLLKNMTIKNPATHRYGPARVLGIMYLQMPAIAGGSTVTSKEYLEFINLKDPQFTLNKIWLSKLYLKINLQKEAKNLLQSIVNLKKEEFEKDWIPETLEDQITAKELLKNISLP
jgi:hypothetical protein